MAYLSHITFTADLAAAKIKDTASAGVMLTGSTVASEAPSIVRNDDTNVSKPDIRCLFILSDIKLVIN